MNFNVKSDFLDTFEQLNALNEDYISNKLDISDTDRDLNAKAFYDAASKKVVDIDAFHKAFDKDLNELGLLGLFLENGKLAHKGTYGPMKNYKDQTHPAIKALKKLWALQFIDFAKTKEVYDQRIKAATEQEDSQVNTEENLETFSKQLDNELFDLINAKLWSEYITASKKPESTRPHIEIKEIRGDKWRGIVHPDASEAKPGYGYLLNPVYSVEEAAEFLNGQLPHLIKDIAKAEKNAKLEVRRKTLPGSSWGSKNDMKIYEFDGVYYLDHLNEFTLYFEGTVVEDIPEGAALVATRKRTQDSNGNRTSADHWICDYISYNKEKMTAELESKLGIKEPGTYGNPMIYTEITEETPEYNPYFYIEGMTNWLRIYNCNRATD